MKHNCPNPKCDSFAIIKKGYYKTKHNHQPVPKYFCKSCKTHFTSKTGTETFGQHKPEVNGEAYKLLASGVTLRRSAKILGVTKKTIERKFRMLSAKAKALHSEYLKTFNTADVHFDEMENPKTPKPLMSKHIFKDIRLIF